MPVIKGSAVLGEDYREIANFCEESRGRAALYNALEVGLNQIKNGETITKEELFKHLNSLIGK